MCSFLLCLGEQDCGSLEMTPTAKWSNFLQVFKCVMQNKVILALEPLVELPSGHSCVR